MKTNTLVMELLRGIWALQVEALPIYGPLAYRFLFENSTDEFVKPQSLFTVFDSNFQAVKAAKNEKITIPKDSIAVVDAIGLLTKYGDICSYGALDIVRALDFANQHPNIIGTVLNVDGPGGSIAAIGPLVEFGKRKTKPVVGLCDQACSAHLFGMLAVSDYIMADNNISAQIGSIGVMLSWMDNKKYLESIGYEFHQVYPDESKHKNESVRLAQEGKYEMIKKEMLSPKAIQFQDFVKEKRPRLKANHPGLLTGKSFGAEEALQLQLIDRIGSMGEAMEMAKYLSELQHIKKN
ncbi:S49 family peptidase [Flavobacterium sp. NKUCC04_CG]|uniref:S49 family peptidase n=1 Tax=Flavobacterium sp. NKUCC04_CG TaxID=2842121 RepID=UPI001C5AD298|nr:S49 family peptidase [Flavobacterium sp. NKUCC04_CG]MBW3519519.1 S49 family peptidase [Flavobacterium sp. NKUCC04_CG]